MAISRVIEVPTSRIERTEEVVITTPMSGAYAVRVNRVTYDLFPDKPPVEVSRRTLFRDLPALLADQDAAAMVSALPALFDRWAAEDDAAATP